MCADSDNRWPVVGSEQPALSGVWEAWVAAYGPQGHGRLPPEMDHDMAWEVVQTIGKVSVNSLHVLPVI